MTTMILDKSLWRASFTRVTDRRWGDCYVATIRQGNTVVYRGNYLYPSKLRAIDAASGAIQNIDLSRPIPVSRVVNRRLLDGDNRPW